MSAFEITQFSGFVIIVASVSAIMLLSGIMKNVVRVIANVLMMGFTTLREIHRASECTLQGLLRPIDSRGEAKLASPRGFQKVNPLIICAIVKINSRGECHGAAWRRIEEQCDAKAQGPQR